MRRLAGLAAAALLFTGCGGVEKATQQGTRQAAIVAARAAYAKARADGTDMRKGPCIADRLLPDWVADVAHDPRRPVDDRAANQCPSYRSGKAHHFVELDPDGNLIRAQ